MSAQPESPTSAAVAPVDTQGPLDAALVGLVAAVGELLEDPEPDGARLAELRRAYGAIQAAQTAHRASPAAQTDRLIDRFAAAVKAKLARAEAKHGWQNAWAKTDWEGECRSHLARHLLKGDPLDVAAYAAFCWHHGWPTKPVIPDVHQPSPWTLSRAFEVGFCWAGLVADHLRNIGWSRDVGRTLTNPMFHGLPMDLDVIPNDKSAEDGVVLAKHEIVRALQALDGSTDVR